jgi:uncharacterized protein
MHGLLRRWMAGFACAAGMLWSAAALGQDVQPVPALTERVVDLTRTLSSEQRGALSSKLAALEQQSGSQVVVLMVATTQPEDIAAYAQRVADQWKVGRRDIGDGIVVVVAKDDRRARIEVAKGLEGAVPDLAAKRIITEQMSPAFKAGDFAGGLNAAVDQLGARIRKEALPAPAPGAPASDGTDASLSGAGWEQLAIFFFAGLPVVGGVLTRLLGRKLGSAATGAGAAGLGWWLTASALVAGGAAILAIVLIGVFGIGAARHGLRGRGGFVPPIVWGGGGGFGGFGGGGSSGGFRSGGGGDFGGGGASGSW